jgi:hypothetical protein
VAQLPVVREGEAVVRRASGPPPPPAIGAARRRQALSLIDRERRSGAGTSPTARVWWSDGRATLTVP